MKWWTKNITIPRLEQRLHQMEVDKQFDVEFKNGTGQYKRQYRNWLDKYSRLTKKLERCRAAVA